MIRGVTKARIRTVNIMNDKYQYAGGVGNPNTVYGGDGGDGGNGG